MIQGRCPLGHCPMPQPTLPPPGQPLEKQGLLGLELVTSRSGLSATAPASSSPSHETSSSSRVLVDQVELEIDSTRSEQRPMHPAYRTPPALLPVSLVLLGSDDHLRLI